MITKLKKLFKKEKKKRFYFLSHRTFFPNQSGQAALEYILVTSLTTIIILGIIYQLNTAFQVWAQSYFGDYLSCLIETGELPNLGEKEAEKKAGNCNSEHKAFSLAEGRPLIKGAGISDASNPNSRDSNRQNNKEISESLKSSNDEEKESETKQSSYPNKTQSAERNSQNNSSDDVFRNSPQHASSISHRNKIPKKIKSAKKSSENNDSSGLKTLNVDGSDEEERVPLSENDMAFISFLSENEEEKKTKVNVPQINQKKESPQENRSKPIPIKVKNQTQEEEIDTQPLSFQGFFRFLIIAGIIIALVVLIGEQFLQIKDSLG